MTEANSEPKPEDLATARRSSSRESSATEPGDEEEANEAKDAEHDEEAPIDENVVEEEQYEEQATEKVQDDEQQLEEEDSSPEEKDTSTEFVPDEPAHKEVFICFLIKIRWMGSNWPKKFKKKIKNEKKIDFFGFGLLINNSTSCFLNNQAV